ncbi:hypothetical protein DFH08DRAFT_1039575 [Mycena albidolilacea]|uniref:Uncharacterized protein n=1 Tax=Mycena albidolilacea TaxID=1033008 RepID=A0AAD6ZDD4_9AGAR|nr:hypothetical protein DFH08DRAFT_1039575 [Mycena albidolilacea]
MIFSGAFVRPETHAQGWWLAALRFGAPISSLPNTLPPLSKLELCSAARHTDSVRTIHSDSQLRRMHDSPPLWALRLPSDHTGLAHRRISNLLKPTGYREGYAALLDAPRCDLRLPFRCLQGQATTQLLPRSLPIQTTAAPARLDGDGCSLHLMIWLGLAASHPSLPGRVCATSSSPFTLPAALPPRVPLRTSSTPRPRRLKLESKRCALRRPPPTHDPRPWPPEDSTSAVRPGAPCDCAALHPDTLHRHEVLPVDQPSSSGQLDTHIPQDLCAWNSPAPRAQYGPHICT